MKGWIAWIARKSSLDNPLRTAIETRAVGADSSHRSKPTARVLIINETIEWICIMHNAETGNSSKVQEFMGLPTSEQFVLWAARIWVKSNHGVPALHLNLRRGFRAAQMDNGYLLLDRIMTLLSTTVSNKLRFHCTCCRGITSHEHALLGIIAEFQTGSEANALMILSNWLPGASASTARTEFEDFAMLLKEKGLHIRERQWLPVGSEEPVMVASPLPTVH